MELELTGEIDAVRLAVAERIEGREGAAEVRELEAVLALLTAAADRAEGAGL